MILRLLDEVLTLGDKGVLLLTEDGEIPLAAGLRLKDARGNVHTVAKVDRHEDWLTLLIENGDAAYFERLFRDVRIDATAFEIVT